MSVPEIDQLLGRASYSAARFCDVVSLADAEHAVLTALDRQRREIVEALREGACSVNGWSGWLSAADFIESRFGGEERDPR